MEDKKVKINNYWFEKHEGDLYIVPASLMEQNVLSSIDNRSDYVLLENRLFCIKYHPVDFPEDIIKAFSIAIKHRLRMGLTITEYSNLVKSSVGAEPIYAKLNEIDLRQTQFLALECKIKNIDKPIVETDRDTNAALYSQYVEIYDDDTSIIIKARFGDKCADFDKWKNGDHVKLIGRYDPIKYRGGNIQLLVSDAVKIEESDEPITITREDEVPGYDNWRKQVLSRDNQQCVCCGLDKHLHVHHLFGYRENPELAVNENNGVTLCKFCHDKYHSVYGLKNINPIDFIDFIKRYGVKK